MPAKAMRPTVGHAAAPKARGISAISAYQKMPSPSRLTTRKRSRQKRMWLTRLKRRERARSTSLIQLGDKDVFSMEPPLVVDDAFAQGVGETVVNAFPIEMGD